MSNHSTVIKFPNPPGSYAWRYSRGLLVISDHVRRYAAIREPRGPYPAPLRNDFVREV